MTELPPTAEALQRLLAAYGHYSGGIDGDIGPKSLAGLRDWALALPSEAPGDTMEHHVYASSFADPADVRRFDACKADGGSDKACFRVGDNGVGKWGDSTRAGTGPSVALPPEDWRMFGDYARGRVLIVTAKATGKSVHCVLKDTMRPKAQSLDQNGCLIDLNPDACAALGLHPPIKQPVTWRWA